MLLIDLSRHIFICNCLINFNKLSWWLYVIEFCWAVSCLSVKVMHVLSEAVSLSIFGGWGVLCDEYDIKAKKGLITDHIKTLMTEAETASETLALSCTFTLPISKEDN